MEYLQWAHRLDCERRLGALSGDCTRVLNTIHRLILMGDDCPSEARIAAEAGQSRSTVQRAKKHGRRLGFLEWERRRVRVGNLLRDQPCRYVLRMPTAPADTSRRERQKEARQEKLNKTTGMEAPRTVAQQLAALGITDPAVQARVLAANEARIAADRRSPPALLYRRRNC